MKRLFAILAIAFLASGCAANGSGYGNKQLFGTLLGGAAGGFLGSKIGGGSGQLAAVAAGTLIGALVGNQIGQSLDSVDQMAAQQAANSALSQQTPIGQPIAWNNPNSGNYGSVTPTRDGVDRQTGAYCREYQQNITVGGQTQSAYGTACQQPDGSWRIGNNGGTQSYSPPQQQPQPYYRQPQSRYSPQSNNTVFTSNSCQQWIAPHYRNDGTYVEGYYRNRC